VQLVNFGPQPASPQQAKHQHSQQWPQPKLARRFAEIKPLRQQMQHGDSAADQLEVKQPRPNDLRDGFGEIWKIIAPQQPRHARGKTGGPDAESKKGGGSKPDRGIPNPQASQKPDHPRTLGKSAPHCNFPILTEYWPPIPPTPSARPFETQYAPPRIPPGTGSPRN